MHLNAGALNAGSITSGFGNIDTGSSTITTTGLGTFGTLAVNGASTITTADNTAQLTLKSTDADSSTGPVLDLTRDSASPADGDSVGEIVFKADDDGGNSTEFASIQTKISDASDGAESGKIEISTIVAGTSRKMINIKSNEVVINEDSIDLDFRVESNGNANMINVDGGNDRVGIGMIPDTTTLTVSGQIGTTNGSASAPTHTFYSDPDTGMFRAGADIIGLSSAGTERYRFSYNSLSLMDPSFANSRLNVSSDIGIYTGMSMITTTNRDNSYFIAFFNASTSLIGGVTQNGTSNVTFETSSDYRLKENVNYSFDATTRLKQLKPCRFNFIADGPDKVFDGFLAHEVSSIVPQAVTREKDATRDIGTIKDEDGNVLKTDAPEVQKENNQTWEKTGTENVYQGIDHSKLVPLLTKALQEQQATIEALTARITALESA